MRSGIEALPQSLRAVRIHNSLRVCMYSCIGIHIYAHFRAREGGDVKRYYRCRKPWRIWNKEGSGKKNEHV